MAILDEHGNHIPLPGTQEQRMKEVLVRTAEQVLARMYTEIPMSKLDEEATALSKLTVAWLQLDSRDVLLDIYDRYQGLMKEMDEARPQIEDLKKRVADLLAAAER